MNRDIGPFDRTSKAELVTAREQNEATLEARQAEVDAARAANASVAQKLEVIEFAAAEAGIDKSVVWGILTTPYPNFVDKEMHTKPLLWLTGGGDPEMVLTLILEEADPNKEGHF